MGKVLCEWTCAQFSYGTSIKTGGVCFNKSYCIAFLEREFRRNSIWKGNRFFNTGAKKS